MTNRKERIRTFILRKIGHHSRDVVSETRSEFNISRQAVHKYLAHLIEEGLVRAEGHTRRRTYALVELTGEVLTYNLPAGLEEDRIWRKDIRPLLQGIKDNVLQICEYGFTEMMNNAIEHSEGNTVIVNVKRDAVSVALIITDDGVGIFKKIKDTLTLEDERHALFELTKGKLTTDPSRHSGEGIFFTSRMFDRFGLMSGYLYFSHSPDDVDWLLEVEEAFVAGTIVSMTIDTFSPRTRKEVFDNYTLNMDEYGFDRTIVPVFLAKYGDENLVSRSQARRLLARFDKFKEVILDFEGISSIGQAFADEIFRVFTNQHPEVNIRWNNTTPEVALMITRARGSRPNENSASGS